MKILIITDYATVNGGVELNALFLKKYFISLGHECIIFTSSGKENKMEIADCQTIGSTSFLRTYLQCFNPFAYYDLKKILSEFKPDVVHLKLFLTQLSPSILTLLKPYKTILHVEMYREICYSGTKLLPTNEICTQEKGLVCVKNKCIKPYQFPFLFFQGKWFEKYKKSFHKVIANSHFLKLKLEEGGFENVQTVWLGVQNKNFEIELELNFKIGFVGRLVCEKGVDLLLNAFAIAQKQIPQLQLDIIGDGPEYNNLLKLCKKLGIEHNVTFYGYLELEKLDSQLNAIDLQVVPSTWHETFGLIIIEAMRRGTPVLATKMGGMTELIEDGVSGLLALPNETSLAQKIIDFYSNPNLKSELSKNGKNRFNSNFKLNKMGDTILKMYQ